MKFFLVLVFVGLSLQAAPLNIQEGQELLVNQKIEEIDRNLAAGELEHPRDKELALLSAMKIGSERLLEHVVARVYGDANNFDESDLEYVEEEAISSLEDDPTIVETIGIYFSKRERIPPAMKAARIFRQYGHRIHASLKNHESIDLSQDIEILLEFIEAGQLDLNKEMVRCTKKKLFELVKFFILNGADVNFWESRYDQSSVLESCIRRPECDISLVKFLVMSGAKMVQEDDTKSDDGLGAIKNWAISYRL